LADPNAPCGGGKVLPLRPTTIDDGEISLGPAKLDPLTANQQAQAVELLTALRSMISRREGARSGFSEHPLGRTSSLNGYVLMHCRSWCTGARADPVIAQRA